MKINQEFFNKIKPILIKLEEKLQSEFVVFGSAPLYLIGVLDFEKDSEFNDLDIAIKDKSAIPKKEAKEVCFRGDSSQKLYKLNIDGISVDIGSAWPHQEDIFSEIFKDPIIVEGFKFANLDICEKWREVVVKKYDYKKGWYHLEKIKSFKRKQIKNRVRNLSKND